MKTSNNPKQWFSLSSLNNYNKISHNLFGLKGSGKKSYVNIIRISLESVKVSVLSIYQHSKLILKSTRLISVTKLI